jgi:hypothetical protein
MYRLSSSFVRASSASEFADVSSSCAFAVSSLTNVKCASSGVPVARANALVSILCARSAFCAASRRASCVFVSTSARDAINGLALFAIGRAATVSIIGGFSSIAIGSVWHATFSTAGGQARLPEQARADRRGSAARSGGTRRRR